jgi:hypothetical protein
MGTSGLDWFPGWALSGIRFIFESIQLFSAIGNTEVAIAAGDWKGRNYELERLASGEPGGPDVASSIHYE